jgi:MoxR-like ATPase
MCGNFPANYTVCTPYIHICVWFWPTSDDGDEKTWPVALFVLLHSGPVLYVAAQALAAFEGRSEVTPGDIYRVIPLCLRHRLRKDPMAEIDSGDKVRVFACVCACMCVCVCTVET